MLHPGSMGDSGGKQVSNWRRLYYVRISMSDGQEFVKEFDDYTESRGFVKSCRKETDLFCIETNSEGEVWLNPKQITTVKMVKVL